MSSFRENKALFDCFIDAVAGDDQNSSQKNSLDKDVSELLLADLEQKLQEII